ncbi:hypothetical protein QBC43DRAFT_78696 [Cladorrhinum sp. PSN259]|nr:hypothetical protein QBC43DRAFT_78696 [Cladorrhinum sp. PSN259]
MMALSYWVLFVLLGGITAAAVIVGWRFESGRRRRQQQQKHDKTPYRVYRDEKKKSYAGGAVQDQDVSPSATEPAAIIEPLPDFDWENEEPLQLRPYKPIYHITMGNVLRLFYFLPSGF